MDSAVRCATQKDMVPLAVTALLTGLVMSLGTQWGCSGTTGC